MEAANRCLPSKVHQFTAVRIAIEIGIFRTMSSMKDSVIGLDGLVAKTRADRLVIG